MADFNFQQYVAPVQAVHTDTAGGAGGAGGEGHSLAFGYSDTDADGGTAAGGPAAGGAGGAGTGTGAGGAGGDSTAHGGFGGFGWPFGGDGAEADDAGDGGAGSGSGAGGAGGAAAGGSADAGASASSGSTGSGSVDAGGGDGGAGGHAFVGATQNVNVSNSFSNVGNEDNDFTVIKNSYNQDNDGFDNSHGHIDDSVVAGRDIANSLNTDDDVSISDSYNDTLTQNATDQSSHTSYTDSFNGNVFDNDGFDLDLDIDDVDVDIH
jgi:hypothetical protein